MNIHTHIENKKDMDPMPFFCATCTDLVLPILCMYLHQVR
jgi:hypothetical protein